MHYPAISVFTATTTAATSSHTLFTSIFSIFIAVNPNFWKVFEPHITSIPGVLTALRLAGQVGHMRLLIGVG